MINVVLLGSTGYIGSALIEQCAAEFSPGEIKIRALVRKGKGKDMVKFPFVEPVEGSLPDSIPASLFPNEPYIIWHFATKQIDNDQSGFQAANVNGTKQLLDKLSPLSQGLIYGSSFSVYGQNAQEGIDEEAPITPNTPLAQSRAKAEELVFDWGRKNKKSAIALRPRFIIGKSDKFIIPAFIGLARKKITIGSGRQAFSVIDVHDYAKIIIHLTKAIIEQPQNQTCLSGAFNVGYEKPLLFSEFIEDICNVMELEKPQKKIPMPSLFIQSLRALPVKKIKGLAVQLELVSLPHYGAINMLRSAIEPSIIEQNPREVLLSILQQYKDDMLGIKTSHESALGKPIKPIFVLTQQNKKKCY